MLRSLLLLSTLTSTPLVAQAAADHPDLRDAFRQLLQARLDVRGGSASIEHRFDPAMTMIDEKGDEGGLRSMLRHFEPRPAFLALEVVIDDVRVDTAGFGGRAAVVTYRQTGQLTLQGERVTKAFRVTEVFRRAPGAASAGAADGWTSVAYHETVIPGVPIPAGADTSQYNDYVGRYELFPGVVCRVQRDSAGRLWWVAGARPPRELVPENANTFVIRGDQYRLIFARDGSGRVSHVRLREFPGVEYNAIRVKE
jgi:hypothetical protein